MIYKEEKRNLFTLPGEYMLAHCISSDYALGGGIAKKFKRQIGSQRCLVETEQ